MGWYFLLAALAAFGTLSILWILFGWLLPPTDQGWLLCPGRSGELSFVHIYLWLRELGLVRCALTVADLGLTEEEHAWLAEKGIESCSLDRLRERLGIGAEEH